MSTVYYTRPPVYYVHPSNYNRPVVVLQQPPPPPLVDPNIKVGSLFCSEGGLGALFSAQHGWIEEKVELHPLDTMIRHKSNGSKPHFENVKLTNTFARELQKTDVQWFREFSFGIYNRQGTLLIVFAAKSKEEMIEWIDAINMVSRQILLTSSNNNNISTQNELTKAAIMECRDAHNQVGAFLLGDAWKVDQLELYPSSLVLRRRDKGGKVTDMNLIGKSAIKVDASKAHHRLHSFVIIDESGVELLQIAAGDEGEMNEWIRDINNAADQLVVTV